MKYIRIGKIVNTHGIKGELRLLSDFKYKNKVFKNDFIIYIGKEKIEEKINTYRKHKCFDMITLMGYSNINEVLKYKGDYVFINKEDLVLGINEYLNEDLIGFKVIYNNLDNITVTGIEKYPSSDMLKVNYNDTFKLIPITDGIIETIDFSNREIVLKDIKGLIE